uniref:B30.2/SPRY domain-containing protein n=1 Tax=Globodera rostochiensis TaxID=31243 RepID=A0A914HKM8_GLORO
MSVPTESTNGNVPAEQDINEELRLLRQEIGTLKENNRKQEQKIADMGEHQQQQDRAIVWLAARVNEVGATGLTLGNRWDSDARHSDLKLTKPLRLIVEHKGGHSAVCSILAERPIPRKDFGYFYFEITITQDSNVYIGLANRGMPLNTCVGGYEGTYSYGGPSGYLWGHSVEGSYQNGNGRPFITGRPKFGIGQKVGCGVNLATRQIHYAVDGNYIDTTGLFVSSTADLYPCVTLLEISAKIEASFGPIFSFPGQ